MSYIKANTGDGATNGVLEMFIDGVQTMGYNNLPFFTRAVVDYTRVREYAQFGFGDRYVDDVAVGDTRIGCGGSDSTAPAAPTGVIIQ